MKLKTALLAATAICIAARAGAADDDSQKIRDALVQLDAKNDEHWTAAGEARIDTLKALTGIQTLTRADVEAASPGFNREKAGGENRPGNGSPPAPPTPPVEPTQEQDPMVKALADGWAPHPTAPGYHYRGQEVVADAELAGRYQDQGAQSAPSGGGQQADQASEPAQDQTALDVSGQTGMGGAMTARSPAPVDGEPRKTHVSELSQGAPGAEPIGVVEGVTRTGENRLGTPEAPAESADRTIELSGEIQARNAGSTLKPTQAAGNASNSETISLGGAADPAVEARAPGGAVIAEGAPPAEVFEGQTVGGPFGSSGTTAGDGPKIGAADVDFEGDPDTVTALEAELEEASARSAELRGQVDNLSAQLHTSLRTEAELRRRIEANRPRSGNMATIQTFLRTSQERRAQAARDAKQK